MQHSNNKKAEHIYLHILCPTQYIAYIHKNSALFYFHTTKFIVTMSLKYTINFICDMLFSHKFTENSI